MYNKTRLNEVYFNKLKRLIEIQEEAMNDFVKQGTYDSLEEVKYPELIIRQCLRAFVFMLGSKNDELKGAILSGLYDSSIKMGQERQAFWKTRT